MTNTALFKYTVDIGQGMYQDFRPFGICNIHVIPLLRFCSRR